VGRQRRRHGSRARREGKSALPRYPRRWCAWRFDQAIAWQFGEIMARILAVKASSQGLQARCDDVHGRVCGNPDGSGWTESQNFAFCAGYRTRVGSQDFGSLFGQDRGERGRVARVFQQEGES